MAVITFDGIELFQKDYHLLHDFFDFFCGKYIGGGEFREVYEFRLDPACVIKINKINEKITPFDNVVEFENWNNINHHHNNISKYLAPCLNISSCGRVLLQKRTTPIEDKQKMPKLIPSFLADTKIQNWGVLNGKVVCHDYANTFLLSKMSKKFRKPAWWSNNYQNLKLR